MPTPTPNITLPKPRYGNVRKLNAHLSVQDTVGRETVVIDLWPETESLVYEYSNLTKSELDSLINFFVTNAGLKIYVIDFDAAEYWAILLTPELQPKQVTRRNDNYACPENELYSLDLEFAITTAS